MLFNLNYSLYFIRQQLLIIGKESDREMDQFKEDQTFFYQIINYKKEISDSKLIFSLN